MIALSPLGVSPEELHLTLFPQGKLRALGPLAQPVTAVAIEVNERIEVATTIKRIATRWALPALALIAGGFICDGLTEIGHHAFLIAGGIALGIGIGRETRHHP